jgi:hypothetical protein
MSRGSWVIEGEGGGRLGCYRDTWTAALKLAQRLGREVTVRYVGPKRPGNRDVSMTDFVARPNGDIDQSIDPTWWLYGRGRS